MKKTISICKELISKFKEAWKIPRKKAGIKLASYFIFLLIFFMIAGIGSRVNTEKNETKKITTTTTTSVKETLSYKQKELLNNNYNIKYEIKIDENNYVINGTLKKGILEGYLEESSGIKKIMLIDGVLNEVSGDIFIPIETLINSNLIDVNYILNLTEQNRAYIENKDGIKTYKYSLDIAEINNTITIFTNEKSITKITINNINSEYILNFDN